jgi:hypothetical protein
MSGVDPVGDITSMTLDIALGMTVWILKVKMKAFQRLEGLEAKETGRTMTPTQLRE